MGIKPKSTKQFYIYATDVVNLIRVGMNKLGCNQADMAKKLGISASFFSDILRGRRDPGEKMLSYLGLERKVVYVPRQVDKQDGDTLDGKG